MSQIIFHACILIGFLIPAAHFLWSGNSIPAASLVLVGTAWVTLERRPKVWAASIGLLFGVLVIAYGSWTILSPLASISSAICLLIAWNLAQFHRFTLQAAPEDDLSAVEQRHLIKTLVFGLAALGISLAGVYIQIRLNFFPGSRPAGPGDDWDDADGALDFVKKSPLNCKVVFFNIFVRGHIRQFPAGIETSPPIIPWMWGL